MDEIIFDATVSACANSDQWQQAMVLLVQAACWRVTRTLKKNWEPNKDCFGKRVGEGNKKHVGFFDSENRKKESGKYQDYIAITCKP